MNPWPFCSFFLVDFDSCFRAVMYEKGLCLHTKTYCLLEKMDSSYDLRNMHGNEVGICLGKSIQSARLYLSPPNTSAYHAPQVNLMKTVLSVPRTAVDSD